MVDAVDDADTKHGQGDADNAPEDKRPASHALHLDEEEGDDGGGKADAGHDHAAL